MQTTDSCDVLVIGAGPAGSACAQMLARAGFDVLLADQQRFPRDKVCGDGLIPDAHRALARLGVLDEVLRHAHRASHIGCIGPRGQRLDVAGTLAVLPRRELDDIVRRAALAAGARWLAPARFEAPLPGVDGEVAGARFSLAPGQALEVRARWTVLATGATSPPLSAAGACLRRAPSGIAMRGYVRNPAMVGRITALEVVWHKALKHGYGWIFPCPDGVFNLGVGLLHDAPAEANLRSLLDDFVRTYAPAGDLMRGGEAVGDFKGAPLRCSLEGAQWSRPGLLITGEAAGSTYSFTGEGIGKALETGMLAAQAIAEGRAARHGDAQLRAIYEASLRALKPRFDLYQKANGLSDRPWLSDLVMWRAQRSAAIMRRIQGVLEETSNPGNLMSLRGLTRLVLPGR